MHCWLVAKTIALLIWKTPSVDTMSYVRIARSLQARMEGWMRRTLSPVLREMRQYTGDYVEGIAELIGATRSP